MSLVAQKLSAAPSLIYHFFGQFCENVWWKCLVQLVMRWELMFNNPRAEVSHLALKHTVHPFAPAQHWIDPLMASPVLWGILGSTTVNSSYCTRHFPPFSQHLRVILWMISGQVVNFPRIMQEKGICVFSYFRLILLFPSHHVILSALTSASWSSGACQLVNYNITEKKDVFSNH